MCGGRGSGRLQRMTRLTPDLRHLLQQRLLQCWSSAGGLYHYQPPPQQRAKQGFAKPTDYLDAAIPACKSFVSGCHRVSFYSIDFESKSAYCHNNRHPAEQRVLQGVHRAPGQHGICLCARAGRRICKLMSTQDIDKGVWGRGLLVGDCL